MLFDVSTWGVPVVRRECCGAAPGADLPAVTAGMGGTRLLGRRHQRRRRADHRATTSRSGRRRPPSWRLDVRAPPAATTRPGFEPPFSSPPPSVPTRLSGPPSAPAAHRTVPPPPLPRPGEAVRAEPVLPRFAARPTRPRRSVRAVAPCRRCRPTPGPSPHPLAGPGRGVDRDPSWRAARCVAAVGHRRALRHLRPQRHHRPRPRRAVAWRVRRASTSRPCWRRPNLRWSRSTPTRARRRAARNGGAGTGVIVSADGDILTNAHVVSRAQTVRVTLDDGTEYPADRRR